jgi:hypothetical protein
MVGIFTYTSHSIPTYLQGNKSLIEKSGTREISCKSSTIGLCYG